MDSAVAAPPRSELLTHRESAGFLRVKPSVLYSRAYRQRAGLPEPIKVGRRSCWTRAQLEDFVQRQVRP